MLFVWRQTKESGAACHLDISDGEAFTLFPYRNLVHCITNDFATGFTYLA
jgi:hypothetical protein